MNRITIDFLETASDALVLLTIVNERRAKLNPYSPLSQRLDRIANKLYAMERNSPAVRAEELTTAFTMPQKKVKP